MLFLFVDMNCHAKKYHYEHPGHVSVESFSSSQRRRVARTLQTTFPNIVTSSSGPTLSPIAFGADPTGEQDSSLAMTRMVTYLMNNISSTKDESGHIDLGGATIDLEGGTYRVSKTVRIPAGYSNFKIRSGTIFASSNFTSNAYILDIGGNGCSSKSGGNKNCNSNIDIQSLTIDGKNVAYGALVVRDTMDVNIGPAIMIVGFEHVGISLTGSGAGYIHEAWLGQFEPGNPTPRNQATATAILLDGPEHDCDVQNVIVFSGKVGVNSTNGANRIQGVHTWNLAGSSGGTGILLYKGSGRVQQCYLDYAPLVVAVGGETSIAMIEGNLFLGSSTIVLQSTKVNAEVRNLIITGNIFHTWNAANTTFVLDETHGSIASVSDTIVESNEVGSSLTNKKLSTRATKAVSIPKGSSSVVVDFADSLLFDQKVGISQARCYLENTNEAMGLSTIVSGNKVTVYLSSAIQGDKARISCDVDQSSRSCAAH